jgi:monoterpene epsilon-lactone hydrolase
MQSFQSNAIKFIVKTFHRTLFIHKTDTNIHRGGFESLAKITKFPRFVEKEEIVIEGIPAMHFKPHNAKEGRLILYLHGGGYSIGSYNTHQAMIARIARACGYNAIAINYRKAPENPFPEGLDDAYKVYCHLLKNNYKKLFLMGDSAGGGLCFATTLKAKDNNIKLPTGIVAISPWVDLTISGDSVRTKKNIDPLIPSELLEIFAKKYYTTHDAKHSYISPLFADLRGMPPTLIQVGSHEVLLDDSTRMARKLKDAEVHTELEIWDKMMHVWHFMAGIIPEGNKAIDKIGDFVHRTHEMEIVTQEKKDNLKEKKIVLG